MAYTFIARMKVFPDKEAQFIDTCERMDGDQAHQDSAHFKEIVPDMIECLDGGYEREFLDPLK